MDIVVLAISSAVTSTIIIVLVYGLLYFQNKEDYLRSYTVGWSAGLLSFIMLLLYFCAFSNDLLIMAYEIIINLAAIFLYYGTQQFLQRKVLKEWLYLAVAIIVWIVLARLSGFGFTVSYLPVVIYQTSLLIHCGLSFLNDKTALGSGKYITGISFILWGLHRLDYMFIMPRWPDLTPWGFIVGTVLVQGITLGVLMQYFTRRNEYLRNNERLFRLLAENAEDVICRYSWESPARFIYVSPASYIVTGYKPDEFYEDPDLLIESIYYEDKHLLQNYLRQPLYRNDIIARLQKPDGSIIWAEYRLTPVFDAIEKLNALDIFIRDITSQKEAEDRLSYLSLYDPLSGLHNRFSFEQQLQQLSDVQNTTIAVIICDLDGLKSVNDTLGHSSGDLMIQAAAQLIKNSFSTQDFVARVGGDEFAVIMKGIQEEEAARACTSLKNNIIHYNQNNPPLKLGMSIGYAYGDLSNTKPEQLLKQADANMYR